MNKLEMQDKRAQLLDRNEAILNSAKAEKRSVSKEETSEFSANETQIRQLDKDVDKAEVRPSVEGKKITYNDTRNLTTTMKKQFSLIEAINNKLHNKNHSEELIAVFDEGKAEMSRSGFIAEGDIVIPTAYRANILAQTTGAGEEIVAEDKKAILPPIENNMVLAKAGATYMTGLVGNVSIPSYSGTTVAWRSEVAAAPDGGGTFSEVLFSPKRLTAYLNVSKTFLAQDGVGAERMLMANIASAVAHKLEETIFSKIVNDATAPKGLGVKATGKAVLTGVTLTNAKMVGMEGAIEAVNMDSSKMSYITNSVGKSLLKTTLRDANTAGMYLADSSNEMNGYPVLVTNAIPSTYGVGGDGNLVAFGNWGELCIAQWGSYDITVDPYSAAKTNQVVIVINAYFDAKGLRGALLTDDYADIIVAESIN